MLMASGSQHVTAFGPCHFERLSHGRERGILSKVNRLRNIVALVLLVFWPAMTSHALLQTFGFIHQVHADHDGGEDSHEHDADHHAFADGDYLRGSNDIFACKTSSAIAALPFVVDLISVSIAERQVFNSGPSPPGTVPLEFLRGWQFSSRTALPVRAPSFAS